VRPGRWGPGKEVQAPCEQALCRGKPIIVIRTNQVRLPSSASQSLPVAHIQDIRRRAGHRERSIGDGIEQADAQASSEHTIDDGRRWHLH
jgi:hypothetical protein